ncbi:MAG: class I SAM-dependent methyltransferase [Candidatus Paceibacterota bacterium]|jgi:cyclopropane fatty-acyl-phospholipid synthase-like methyltransferase
MKDLNITYDEIAEKWSQSRPNEWMKNSLDKFIAFLKPGSSVLDVGCGSGDKSKYMQERGMNVTGIDFSSKMIEIAKQDVPNAHFEVLDINNLSKHDSKYDAIFARAVLLHFPKNQINRLLNMFANHLNEKGYIYIAVKMQKENEKGEEIVKEFDYDQNIERFFSYFTLEELKKYVTDLNLEICFADISQVKNGTRKWIQLIVRKK